MPFQRLAARVATDGESSGADPDLLRRVGFAVGVAGANVPWRSDCFPQAIAASRLLKRLGHSSAIHFGVDKAGPDDLVAHAWLTCGGIVVTGEGDLDRYVEIHRFGE